MSRKGPRRRAGELLLQPAASRDSRHVDARRRTSSPSRARVARPRMVERVPRARRARLGLDRHQPRRRRRADGVRHPRHATAATTGRAARCATRRGAQRVLAPRRRSLRAAAPLALAAHGRRAIPSRCACTPATSTLELVPLIDDQELDSRASVGTIYWEGAVRALAGGRRRRARLSRAHRVRRAAEDLAVRECRASSRRRCFELEDVLRLGEIRFALPHLCR